MTSQSPTPETINRLRGAVNPSYALLAGVQLGVFTALKDGAMTAQQIAVNLAVHAGKLEVLLCALVPTGLLQLESEKFSNSAEADSFLVRGLPGYLGDGYENTASERWTAILRTADSIREGTAKAKMDYVNANEEELNAHYQMFFDATQARGRSLAARFDFSDRRRLLDVAGGTGGLAIALTAAYPNLSATVVDLPSVTPTTQRYVDAADAGGRVKIVSADVIAGPLEGSYDVAVVGAFLPVISVADARRALMNVGAVMEPGGDIYISDTGTVDDYKTSPPEIALSSLYFVNAFDEGGPKTESDRRRWLEEAGFENIQRLPFPEGGSIMVARKSG
ncbi:MAG: methyltransferase domain-containing protein [Chloroflexi bacterium]|nr:methyltransferase domain-containing protein [Chloroflexota bacterium]